MIEIKNVSFTYSGSGDENCLKNFSLSINPGEVVLLCGLSGCGKTTVTRLVNGLIPNYYEGEFSGTVKIGENNISALPLYETARLVGSVFQNPRSQFFTVDTDSELAFGCENFGMEKSEILARVDKTVASMKLSPLLGRSMFALSGGQKQQIACGSVSVLQPEVIVLDEPSSNLDVGAMERLHDQIVLWKSQGKTVLIAEHRLLYLSDIVDRVILMENGTTVKTFSPDTLRAMETKDIEALQLRVFTRQQLVEKTYHANSFRGNPCSKVKVKNLQFSHKRQKPCLHVAEEGFPENAVVAIVGKNGAGKSTLVRCLCGLEKRHRGSVLIEGNRIAHSKRLRQTFMVMQDVNHQLFTESVLDEVMLSMAKPDESMAKKILAQLGLLECKERHPVSLSGGQKQRVAIACAVASERDILIFDEPTSGLDLKHMKLTASVIKWLREIGKTQLVVTHDPEFILECCTHVTELEDGRIVRSYPLDSTGLTKFRVYLSGNETCISAEKCARIS